MTFLLLLEFYLLIPLCYTERASKLDTQRHKTNTSSMETIANFACQNAHSSHWIFFLLLLLAGINVPISEDVILIIGGAVASICIPNETLFLFCWIYAGCIISAWEAYWIGRYFGPKIYNVKWLKRIVTPQRIVKLHEYYEKFGILTFIVGRFIPGGVRNALFMTAGLGKMPFSVFVLRDSIACLISASTLYYLGFLFGQNIHDIIYYFSKYNRLAFILFVCILFTLGFFLWKRSRKNAMPL